MSVRYPRSENECEVTSVNDQEVDAKGGCFVSHI